FSGVRSRANPVTARRSTVFSRSVRARGPVPVSARARARSSRRSFCNRLSRSGSPGGSPRCCGLGRHRIPCMRPPFSISQITTLGATLEAALRAYAAAGVDGIGIWEIKLPEGGDEHAHEQLEASGLGRAAAVPAVPSILPLPLMYGRADPSERIEAICASVHRLARFEPSSVV